MENLTTTLFFWYFPLKFVFLSNLFSALLSQHFFYYYYVCVFVVCKTSFQVFFFHSCKLFYRPKFNDKELLLFSDDDDTPYFTFFFAVYSNTYFLKRAMRIYVITSHSLHRFTPSMHLFISQQTSWESFLTFGIFVLQILV